MKLSKIRIEGYRSIEKPLELYLEPDVTVILGANDHGKTNILNAITHLNPQNTFKSATDLNWDHDEEPDRFPSIAFSFVLNKEERERFLEEVNSHQTLGPNTQQKVDATAPSNPQPSQTPNSPAPPPPQQAPAPESAPINESYQETLTPQPDRKNLSLKDIPETIIITRQGVDSGLSCDILEQIDENATVSFLDELVPRVELIEPIAKVSDSVTPEQIKTNDFEFMRGIFYYAGLDPDESDSLFSKSDVSSRKLDNASKKLDSTLKKDWSQGTSLNFRLDHGDQNEIIFRIDDPNVKNRRVRASQRSSGFTHFFSLKTVLYARQNENPANSYIFLFDDPGVYLHPTGQKDLLSELDSISKTSQLLYSTHSIFLINKTFYSRHRLIKKDENGTEIDGKPYLSRWGSAIEWLGMSLSGTVLFAQHVLLGEGASEPFLIPRLFQRLVILGYSSIDLNSFSVIAQGDEKEAAALIRLLQEGAFTPSMVVLCDGDKGGSDRLKALKPVIDEFEGIQTHQLSQGLELEDYLIWPEKLYVEAVVEYACKLKMDRKQKFDRNKLKEEFEKSFENRFKDVNKFSGISDWADEAFVTIGKLDSAPSKIGVAREYVRILFETKDSDISRKSCSQTLVLLKKIQEKLGIPNQREMPQLIFDE